MVSGHSKWKSYRSSAHEKALFYGPFASSRYRGFVLSNPEHIAGLPVQIHVYDGMIFMDEEGNPRGYRDTHGLEGTLLRQASQRGYGKILKALLPTGDQRF